MFLISVPFAALALAGFVFLVLSIVVKVSMREVTSSRCNCHHHNRRL